MSNIILEVCADAPDDAATAASAGADRIELCTSLETGGLTPSVGLVRNAISSNVPLFAMIRPRAGDFHYSEAEVACMLADIECFQDCGISGFVFGALDPQNNLAEETLGKLIAACNGLPTTLNRAFDLCSDPLGALDLAIRLGFDRILTSGASSSVSAGLPLLAKLFEKADERIIIVPGGGVTPATVVNLLDNLPVREIHASCKSPARVGQKTISDVNLGRNDGQERFHTDAKILGELLRVIRSWQEDKNGIG
jgi:copper homeostasis protein